ncbi:hypothetical protein Swit_1527 [Rhizorhabdus wittichii RW1]|uniref:Cytochrome c domain-containing protein n=1 Tax=Rhizorhabdus wittichii (strain DSM 6014 / CCUG 31198 / JCM 15750 / NBRC 105917 / EY 4224 / RW1) TaxID=392499 RepID=A0A9J9HA76_RHIWR|nr:hypothetical protein Swit_1527 [Rhizorhabdus wittichii RW1]
MRATTGASAIARSVVALLLLTAGIAQAGPAEQRGRKLYLGYGCSYCHGSIGQGGGRSGGAGPKLAPDALPYAAILGQLRQPYGIMPRFSERIVPDCDVADISAYLRSIPAGKSAHEIDLLR